MGIISKLYIKNLVHRYDKEVGVPYYSFHDFKGLKQERHVFNNSLGTEIHYFFYSYDGYEPNKIVLFCHGIGPGHTAYMCEINELAKRGYRVLTLDYAGCEESKGEMLRSLNSPTRDVVDLLDYLNLKDEIVLAGHSLGGYTALNVINLRPEIHKAILLSPFISIPSFLKAVVHIPFIEKGFEKYEKTAEPAYFDLKNEEYLKNTNDKLLVIQSDDDPIIPYDVFLKVVEEINNPNIKTVRVTNKKHNPNYTEESVLYLNDVFGRYNELVKKKKIQTDDERINFFKDVSLARLCQQDKKIIDLLDDFIR